MGKFARSSQQTNLICTSNLASTSCDNASCSSRCEAQIINSCASGKACEFNCDDFQENFESEGGDVGSGDDVFKHIENATTNNDAYSTDSSEEDCKDAFEGFEEAQSSKMPSAKKPKLQDFKTFIKNESRMYEPTKKKDFRQKGDAESLKKYAYGKLVVIYLYS
jgi:hypothetical protein